jgi:hypothetical protein
LRLDAANSAAICVAGSVNSECEELLPPKDIDGGLDDDEEEGVSVLDAP